MVQVELQLQRRTNRKSYGLSNCVIFNNLERPHGPYPCRFQGQAILWRWISPKWLYGHLPWKANRKPYL